MRVEPAEMLHIHAVVRRKGIDTLFVDRGVIADTKRQLPTRFPTQYSQVFTQ